MTLITENLYVGGFPSHFCLLVLTLGYGPRRLNQIDYHRHTYGLSLRNQVHYIVSSTHPHKTAFSSISNDFVFNYIIVPPCSVSRITYLPCTLQFIKSPKCFLLIHNIFCLRHSINYFSFSLEFRANIVVLLNDVRMYRYLISFWMMG